MIKEGRGKLQVWVVQTPPLEYKDRQQVEGEKPLFLHPLGASGEGESEEKAVKGQSALLPFAHTLPLPSCPVLACSPRKSNTSYVLTQLKTTAHSPSSFLFPYFKTFSLSDQEQLSQHRFQCIRKTGFKMEWLSLMCCFVCQEYYRLAISRTVTPILSIFEYDTTNPHTSCVIFSEDKACLYLRQALHRTERYCFPRTE